MKYYTQYKNIKKDTINAVRYAISEGLFKKEIEDKKLLISQLHSKLSKIYNISESKIQYINNYIGVGSYNKDLDLITLNTPSLITYLHEFCHSLRVKTNKLNAEEIARGWSISLYYLAAPKLCIKSIKEGKIIHQTEI